MRNQSSTQTVRRLSSARVRSAAQDTARHLAAAPVPQQEDTDEDEPVSLSKRVQTAVDKVRSLFRSYVEDFAALTASTEDLAPTFMQTYRRWEGETGGSFVAFVRVLVPDLPMETKAYKLHKAYNAADNLRRVAGRLEREGTNPVERAQRIANAPVAPRRAFLSLLSAVAPLIQPDALDLLFDAMKTRLHWSEATVDGIKDAVENKEETPLVLIRPPRGVHIDQGLVVRSAPVVAEDVAKAS